MIEFTAQSPPEPAVRSVVLDPDEVAWQRLDPGEDGVESVWVPARPAFVSFVSQARSWPVLLVEKRRLRLIHDAARNGQVSAVRKTLADQLDEIPPR